MEDAIEAEFDVILKTKNISQEMVLDLSDFRPKEMLRKVRKAALERLTRAGYEGTMRLAVR